MSSALTISPPHYLYPMRSALAIGLILSVTLPFLGTWHFYNSQVSQIRREVKRSIQQGLKDEELVVLSFHTNKINDLYWEHDDEFEYFGQMYDVISQKEANDSIHYTCYHDTRETFAKNKLRNTIAAALAQKPTEQNRQMLIQLFFKNLFLPDHPTLSPLKVLDETDRFAFFTNGLTPVTLGVPAEPPETAV